jgi:hypothetical protein
MVTGIDERIRAVDGLDRQLKLNIVVVLEWFGRTVREEMIHTHTFRNRTGRLERSLGYTVEAWTANTIQIMVFATAPYARAVEEGTSRSRPYPYFWPVFYKHLTELYQRLQQAVDSAFADAVDTGRVNVFARPRTA